MIGPTNNYKKYLDQEYTPIDSQLFTEVTLNGLWRA